ncbi:MAG: hypothetical protein ACRDUA_07270 [Micromonosporaceae bacterium]
MTSRRTFVVTGRQGARVTIVVEVCRGKVWMVSVDPPFNAEAIFEPARIESFIDLLSRAAAEARGGATDHTPVMSVIGLSFPVLLALFAGGGPGGGSGQDPMPVAQRHDRDQQRTAVLPPLHPAARSAESA